jgi:hypothetical protein
MASLDPAEVFTTGHIAITVAISRAVAGFAAITIADRRDEAVVESVMIGVLTAAAVFLWRKSATTPS